MMTHETSSSSEGNSVVDRLINDLRARSTAPDGQDSPVAILWTDPKGEWRPLIGALQSRVEEILILGEYQPESHTGPSIWIRCLVDGLLEQPALPDGCVPIIYLPGVARQEMRAGEDCRPALRPLVELMHRGTMWLQPNGSDWTVTAFMMSPKALGLDLARDHATTEALLRALPEVALTPIGQLRGHRLQADDFDRMLTGDLLRDLLRWMGDPEATKARLGSNGFTAFCNRCRDEMGFDPSVEADVVAGARLAEGKGPWAAAWVRFAEAPGSYTDVVRLLRRSRTAGATLFNQERWPDLNDELEQEVRADLGRIPSLPQPQANEKVLELEKHHGKRRDWVWARIGLSPMAMVLEPLARLAAATGTSLGGASPDDVAAAYRERGWQADAASWEAVAAAPTADESLVSGLVHHLIRPWLDEAARAFQAAVDRSGMAGPGSSPAVEAAEEGCVLFADGLRYDLGVRLAERLEGRGCRVKLATRWTALPAVTATSKPAVSPVADEIEGRELGEDFAPVFKQAGARVHAQTLRDAIRGRGYQVLGEGLLDVPMLHPARGWAEAGEIDSLGHKLGGRLARQIGEELDRLAERVLTILECGWKSVRVVTDHGWLLLPGGLPKVDLPKHLTACRWARCAVISEGATPEVPRFAWYWNDRQTFATAPGIACFNKTDEYAHGGLSIQECLVPDLLIERAAESGASAQIRSVTWRGLRCFVEVSVRGGTVFADLRLQKATGPSVVAATKPIEPDGSVSLVLSGDEHEHDSLVLVLLGEPGQILAQKPTRVGVDS